MYKTCLARPEFGMTIDPLLYGHGPVVRLGPNGSLPAPLRDYLALHAACCRVAHASAAAGYLDDLDRRCEVIDVITSSDDLIALNSRIWHAASGSSSV